MDIVEPIERHKDQRGYQIGAVVHGQLRAMIECGGDMLVIRGIVLAADGEHGNSEVAH